MLTIEPELPGVIGQYLWRLRSRSRAPTKGQTTYTVTVRGSIQDVFGQTLGKDARADLQGWAGRARSWSGPGRPSSPSTRRQKARPFPFTPSIIPELDVQIYAVQPSDWPAFKQYLREYQRTDIKLTSSRAPGAG